MKFRLVLTVTVLITLLAIASGATAQSRLSLEVGPLLPLGNLDDSVDASLYFGGRWELQNTNALGQVRLLSFFARAGYSPLQIDSAVERVLEDAGQSTSAGYFDAGVGARVYARATPLFLSAGAGYANLNPVGDQDSANGFVTHLGAGFSQGMGGVHIEVEGRGHFAVMSDIDNVEFFTITASVGLPF